MQTLSKCYPSFRFVFIRTGGAKMMYAADQHGRQSGRSGRDLYYPGDSSTITWNTVLAGRLHRARRIHTPPMPDQLAACANPWPLSVATKRPSRSSINPASASSRAALRTRKSARLGKSLDNAPGGSAQRTIRGNARHGDLLSFYAAGTPVNRNFRFQLHLCAKPHASHPLVSSSNHRGHS